MSFPAMEDKIGEKRPLEAAENLPLEKKSKIDTDSVVTEEPNTFETERLEAVSPLNAHAEVSIFGDYPDFSTPSDAPAAPQTADVAQVDLLIDPSASNEDLGSLELSPGEIEQASSLFQNTTEGDAEDESHDAPLTESELSVAAQAIPYPPGYDPDAANLFHDPLVPVLSLPRRTRRKKSELLQDEYPDPENKWSQAATERMLSLFVDFGKRRVLDEKLHNELMVCLEHGGNPAVTLTSPDGQNFFTYLTVAAECGDMKLVVKFLTEFREEFSRYDFEVSLLGALQNREQEIAEYLLRNTDVVPDNETLMEMFDTQMSDDTDRKVLPLRAFLDRCIDTGRFKADNFFVPEILNRCVYAHNVASLEVLFERKKAEFLPLLEVATPESKIIRAGRAKAIDIGEGVPPLAYAAVMERGECLEVFLKHGANPNFNFPDMGGTLLHIVGFKGNTELIELLLEYNADPRIPNANGVTILSRTKGRKARKFINDSIARLNQLDGIHPSSVHPSSVHPSTMLSGSVNLLSSVPSHLHASSLLDAAHFMGTAPIVLNQGTASPMNFNAMLSVDHQSSMPDLDNEMAQPLPFEGSDPLAAPPLQDRLVQSVDLMDVSDVSALAPPS